MEHVFNRLGNKSARVVNMPAGHIIRRCCCLMYICTYDKDTHNEFDAFGPAVHAWLGGAAVALALCPRGGLDPGLAEALSRGGGYGGPKRNKHRASSKIESVLVMV